MQVRVGATLVVAMLCLPFGACREKDPAPAAASSATSAASAPLAPEPKPEPVPAQLDLTPSREDESAPTEQEVSELREHVARSVSRGPRPFKGSPEAFAKSMKSTIDCGKRRCRAGHQVCVVSP